MNNQTFRFCCSCGTMTLMQNNGCYFCGCNFVVSSPRDDFNTRKKKNAETYESIS